LPQAFLAIDAVLGLYENVARAMVVYPQVIAKNLAAELPFMASENILMAAVAAGGDRQALHELIRQHSQAAARVVKRDGKPNDLLQRLAGDPSFARCDLVALVDVNAFLGCAPQQVDDFVASEIAPIRARYKEALQTKYEPRV
jgi:adenylosuccinate lyase